VSVDEEAKPVEAIKVVPETEDEKRRFEKALQRRETRLAEKKSH